MSFKSTSWGRRLLAEQHAKATNRSTESVMNDWRHDDMMKELRRQRSTSRRPARRSSFREYRSPEPSYGLQGAAEKYRRATGRDWPFSESGSSNTYWPSQEPTPAPTPTRKASSKPKTRTQKSSLSQKELAIEILNLASTFLIPRQKQKMLKLSKSIEQLAEKAARGGHDWRPGFENIAEPLATRMVQHVSEPKNRARALRLKQLWDQYKATYM